MLKTEIKKEVGGVQDDIYLSNQFFSFIHLTFQEYLAASEIVTILLNYQNEEGKLPEYNLEIGSICQFLAEQRENPKYFMLLKFMSGIVAKKENDDLTQAFWEAMTCNLDGVLDLGSNKKVELLMHLLGQINKAKYKQITEKIPNYNSIEKYIDDTITEQGILKWTDVIKSSNYLSQKMQTTLLQTSNLKLIIELISTIDNKISFENSENQECYPYNYIEELIIRSFMNDQKTTYPLIIKAAPFIEFNPESKLQIVNSLLERIEEKSLASVVKETLKVITKNIKNNTQVPIVAAINDKLMQLIDKLFNSNKKEDLKSAALAIGKLPWTNLNTDQLSTTLDSLLRKIIDTDSTSYANYLVLTIAQLPHDQVTGNQVATVINSLIKLITETEDIAFLSAHRNTDTAAIDRLDKLLIDKLTSQQIKEMLDSLKEIISKGKQNSVDAVLVISKLPWRKLSENEISLVVKAMMDLIPKDDKLDILIENHEIAYTLRAISELPLDILTREHITEMMSTLIKIISKSSTIKNTHGDSMNTPEAALSMFSKLPVDKISDNQLSEIVNSMINLIPQGGSIVREVTKVIGNLPPDKISVDQMSAVVNLLLDLTPEGGWKGNSVYQAISELPLHILTVQPMLHLIESILSFLSDENQRPMEGIMTSNYQADGAVKAISKLPWDKLSKGQMSPIVDTIIGIISPVQCGSKFAVKVLNNLPKCAVSQDQISTVINILMKAVMDKKVGIYPATEIINMFPKDKILEEHISSLVELLLQDKRVLWKPEYISKFFKDSVSKEQISPIVEEIMKLFSEGKMVSQGARAISKLPLDKILEEQITRAIEISVECLNNPEKEKVAQEAMYNIALGIPPDKIVPLLGQHLHNNQLPNLIDNVANNILSRTVKDFSTVKQIKALLDLSVEARESQKLEISISSMLNKVVEQGSITLLKEAALTMLQNSEVQVLIINDIVTSNLEREFLTKVYERILSNPISEKDLQIIEDLIKAGFTTSIIMKPKTSPDNHDINTVIIFNGKKYEIKAQTSEEANIYVNQITEFIYSQSTNKVQFKNSGKFLPKAAIEVNDSEVKSIIDNTTTLDKQLILTKINEHNAIYTESRDIYGRHCITKYKFNNSNNSFERFREWCEHPKTLSCEKNGLYTKQTIKKKESILGKYKDAHHKFYEAFMIIIDKNQYNSEAYLQNLLGIISSGEIESLQAGNKRIDLLLFHEELVGKNGYDRSDYIQNASRKIKQECKILAQKHGALEGDITYINQQVEQIDSNSFTDSEKIKVICSLLDEFMIKPLEITLQEDSHSTRIIEEMRMQIIKQEDKIQQQDQTIENQTRTIESLRSTLNIQKDEVNNREEEELLVQNYPEKIKHVDSLNEEREVQQCNIFKLTDIQYDHELLNHPELLERLAFKYGMSKAIDIGALLSRDLVIEVVTTNDAELLLAGADSLFNSVTTI